MNEEEQNKLQYETLKNLLLKLENKYLTDKNVCRILLQGSKLQRHYLDLIDVVHQNLITSIKFKQYRRAQRFLIALIKLCVKCFT